MISKAERVEDGKSGTVVIEKKEKREVAKEVKNNRQR